MKKLTLRVDPTHAPRKKQTENLEKENLPKPKMTWSFLMKSVVDSKEIVTESNSGANEEAESGQLSSVLTDLNLKKQKKILIWKKSKMTLPSRIK